ncbi:hypothetical protein [Blastopirellula marina]|uniref:Uncharacterized protein n=1 Tax=Blastopirellula marina TaxID=124 RepID=A0A2S8GPL7_9BACT|nr:hypothetical protein [Blastopirellula marina]PQO46383.1 hypothetical protein C5Y93_10400 [Blastopirellula marina]
MDPSPNKSAEQKPAASVDPRHEQLFSIAMYQRLTIVAFVVLMSQFALGYVATALQRRVVPFGVQPTPEEQAAIDAINQGHTVLHLALSIFAGVIVFILAKKLYGLTGAIWAGVLQAVPCISLVAMVVVYLKATEYLNARGIEVGNFGVSQESLRKQLAMPRKRRKRS